MIPSRHVTELRLVVRLSMSWRRTSRSYIGHYSSDEIRNWDSISHPVIAVLKSLRPLRLFSSPPPPTSQPLGPNQLPVAAPKGNKIRNKGEQFWRINISSWVMQSERTSWRRIKNYWVHPGAVNKWLLAVIIVSLSHLLYSGLDKPVFTIQR